MTTPGRNGTTQQGVHVGDPDGRICLWLNKSSARGLLDFYPLGDTGANDVIEGLKRAYPEDADDDE